MSNNEKIMLFSVLTLLSACVTALAMQARNGFVVIVAATLTICLMFVLLALRDN